MKALLLLLLLGVPVMGQVAKKPVTEADYKLWSTMENHQLSDDGNWASYSVRYESGKDTLFVKHTRTLKTYAFAEGTDGQFAKEQFFASRGTEGNLIVTNLKNSKQVNYPGISNYSIAMGGKILVLLKNNGTVSDELMLVDANGQVLQTIPKVTLYSLNPALNMLVCNSEGKLQLVDLKRIDSPEEVDAIKRNYKGFAWQGNGASVAYIAEDKSGTVGYYRIKEKKVYNFDQTTYGNFPKDAAIYNASVTELTISDDGSHLFFGVKEKETASDTTVVQLWNIADKMLYPMKASIKGWTARPKLAVWFPERQQFSMVTDAQFPYQELLPGQELALVYNPFENEPQFDRDGPIDFYLRNITTGRQRLILPKFSADHNKIGISAAGKFIAYFTKNQWWLYDVKSDSHRDLTSQTGQSFTDEKYDRSGEEKVLGIAGWTAGDAALLVYDSYDIWLLKTDGTTAVRLTKGREENIVYRLVLKSSHSLSGATISNDISLDDGLVLSAVGSAKSGYFTWDTKKGLRAIVFENNRIGGITVSGNGEYTYTREHYHISPQLVVQHKGTKSKLLYESNPQHKKYQWGFSKLISYGNFKGQLLNGALFYPARYDAEQRYPMVVYIYERLSDFFNQYVNPSLLNSEGFNISNLTSKGYFVLLPDIAYKEGETGKSALDCVSAAVEEVCAHESVDPKKLGLLGHSFGGYETNFIVTQTNRFAAVISGSGMSDIISSYLAVCWNNQKPNGWRYEFNQNRMGVSLFDGYQKYLDNSPITFANQIQTPILLWSGDSDKQVDYYQSLEFHLALRRLQKPNILLLYEGENHTIMKRGHQIDLTYRTQEWFDYYLKDTTKPDWFAPDRL